MSAQVQACRQSMDESTDRNVESDEQFCWALSIHLGRRSIIGI